MLRKWYIELPTILSVIILAVYLIMQTDSNVSFKDPNQVTIHKKEDSVVVSPAYIARMAKKEIWMEGKSLFKSNCASCHNPKADGTGPALQGVTERWQAAGKYKKKTGKQWLYSWVRNWHDVVNSGYSYGTTMANSRPSEMNIFSNLSDKQIEAILFYVESPDVGRPIVMY